MKGFIKMRLKIVDKTRYNLLEKIADRTDNYLNQIKDDFKKIDDLKLISTDLKQMEKFITEKVDEFITEKIAPPFPFDAEILLFKKSENYFQVLYHYTKNLQVYCASAHVE